MGGVFPDIIKLTYLTTHDLDCQLTSTTVQLLRHTQNKETKLFHPQETKFYHHSYRTAEKLFDGCVTWMAVNQADLRFSSQTVSVKHAMIAYLTSLPQSLQHPWYRYCCV